jgi:hypothetical protein
MNLMAILISILILAGLILASYQNFYSKTPSGDVDTSYPAVERQLENLEDNVGRYDDSLKSYQDTLNNQ